MKDTLSQSFSARRCAQTVVFMLLFIVGCQGTTYKSTSLPDEFRVPLAKNVTTVNLTKLASPGPGNSRIGSRDLLEVTIASGYEVERNNTLLLRVAENGTINIPLIGEVEVADLEPAEAEQNIATLSIQRGVYRRPYVTVVVKRQWVNHITVVGAVVSQGTFELPRGSSDLLGALAAAGGLSDDAGEIVEILRKSQLTDPMGAVQPGMNGTTGASLASYTGPGPTQPASIRINLAELSRGVGSDFRLGDGDVVMVLPQDPRVIHVLGLVHNPGQFEIPPNKDVYVLDALAWAGGRKMQIANTIRVIRRVPGRAEPITIGVSVRQAKANGKANMRLGPGDLVSVEDTPTTVLLDALKSFIRFGVSSTVPLF